MVGFSCHDDMRAGYLAAAAQGGFINAIMVKYSPFFTKGDPFDQALDACHQAGIGIVAMKTMRNTHDVPSRLPELDKMGLDVHQALLHACWSDERISAVCIMIDNVGQMENIATAARAYKEPLHASRVETLRQLVLAGRRTMCPGCPGLRWVRRHHGFCLPGYCPLRHLLRAGWQSGRARDAPRPGPGSSRFFLGRSRRPSRPLRLPDGLPGNHATGAALLCLRACENRRRIPSWPSPKRAGSTQAEGEPLRVCAHTGIAHRTRAQYPHRLPDRRHRRLYLGEGPPLGPRHLQPAHQRPGFHRSGCERQVLDLRVDASQASDATIQSTPSTADTTADAQQPSAAPASAAALKKDPLEIYLPGIKPMGDTEFYSSDDLYQKIDGRSPAYQGFNVQELRCRTFSIDGGGSSYVDVYEYRMDTNVDAFGIFALERDPKGKPLAFAKDGYSGEMGYFFRQGPVYVQIIASDQNPKTMQIAEAVAENRARVLPADDSGLDGRRALPSAGLVPGSITFVQDNAQGQDFLKNVFQGTYDFEGKKLSYFVMASTPEEAASAWNAYLGFCGKFGGKANALSDINGAKVFQASNFGTFKVIFQRGNEIGGVVDATEAGPALDFVTHYLQGQSQ